MKIQKTNTSEQPFRKSVAFMLVFYWAVLVAWQNISGAVTRGSVDLMVKIGLLMYFSWFYLKQARFVSVKILWVYLLAFSLMFTAFREPSFPLSNVIAYSYPIIFLTMVYGLGDKYEITREHLIAFCNWVIGIMLYAAVYAFVFCREQFAGVLLLRSAYGNELTSFFISNYEYGMYLSAAIISCFICLKYGKRTKQAQYFYIAVMFVFTSQLILTFSRSTIFALGICMVVYSFLGKGKSKYWIIGVIVVGMAILLLVPTLREFIYRIVMKENTWSGRDVLTAGAIDHYRNGSVVEKLFGYGVQRTYSFVAMEYGHGSLHSAYLQVLICYGMLPVIAMIVFLVSQTLANIRFLKDDRFLGTVFLGQVLMAMAMMLTTTSIVFTSTIDSYFLSMFFIVLPKYVRNSIRNNTFW